MARFTSSGQIDTSFAGGDGLFDREIPGVRGAADIAVLDDDSIVAAIDTYDLLKMTAIRIRHNGKWDRSFGRDGRAESDLPSSSRAMSIVTTADRIVLAGGVHGSGEYDNDLALAAFTLDGELDDTFGDAGMIQASVLRQDRGTAVGIQPDGRLVVVGAAARFLSVPPRKHAFARFLG